MINVLINILLNLQTHHKFGPFINFQYNIGYTNMFEKHNTRTIENSPTIQSKEFLLRCTLVWFLKVSLCYQTELNCNIAVNSSAMYSSPHLIHYLVLQSGRLLTAVYYNALSLQESLFQASKRRGSPLCKKEKKRKKTAWANSFTVKEVLNSGL